MARSSSRPRQVGVRDDERAMFRAAVADVHPIACDRVLIEPPPPFAIVRRPENAAATLARSLHVFSPDTQAFLHEGCGEPAWMRPGLSRRILKDLRRGRWAVQAELDLHGCNRDEALERLAEFVARGLLRGSRCLHIVHGKGYGSPGGEPVLKTLVCRWLQHRREILAFCQASGPDGGSGALRVLLAAT